MCVLRARTYGSGHWAVHILCIYTICILVIGTLAFDVKESSFCCVYYVRIVGLFVTKHRHHTRTKWQRSVNLLYISASHLEAATYQVRSLQSQMRIESLIHFTTPISGQLPIENPNDDCVCRYHPAQATTAHAMGRPGGPCSRHRDSANGRINQSDRGRP